MTDDARKPWPSNLVKAATLLRPSSPKAMRPSCGPQCSPPSRSRIAAPWGPTAQGRVHALGLGARR
eukprot:3445819-Alexandrium_andersonii.AAC.1